MPIKDYFTGTDLWKTLLLASGYIFLVILMFCLVSQSFEAILPLVFGYCIWIAIAFTIMREQKIRNLEKYGGIKILTGPLDEREDEGEIVEFEVGKITRYYKLPQKLRQGIVELVLKEKSMLVEMDRRENIVYRLNREDPQLKYIKGTKEQLKEQPKEQPKETIVVEDTEQDDDYEGEDYDDDYEDDFVEVDQDFQNDLISFPSEEDLKNIKEGKFNGTKINLKEKK